MGRLSADGFHDEIDNGGSEKSDDEANDGIENGVFGVGNFFGITTRDDITKTTVDEHDNGDGADDNEGGVADFADNSGEVARHAFLGDEFDALFNRSEVVGFVASDSHGATSKKSCQGGGTCKNFRNNPSDFFHMISQLDLYQYNIYFLKKKELL